MASSWSTHARFSRGPRPVSDYLFGTRYITSFGDFDADLY